MENNLELLLKKQHSNPHSFLGLHENIIRVFHPENEEIFLEVNKKKRQTTRIDSRGLFEYKIDQRITKFDYKIYFTDENSSYDPYSFDPDLKDEDIEKFLRKGHFELYNILGAHKKKVNGINGIQFGLWAPNAKGVSLVCDFNNWNGKINPLKNVKNYILLKELRFIKPKFFLFQQLK